MASINDNYLELSGGYLFQEIARRVRDAVAAQPDAKLIRLGIGDVTQPLPAAIIKAFHEGVDHLASARTFVGYGPERGHDFLLDAIIERAYKPLGVSLTRNEIFISDGSKCDCANILDIFGADNKVAISDPVYPVYNDTNVMVGRSSVRGNIVYLPCLEENQFVPSLPKGKVDLIYLCFPNNPTGVVATKEQLKAWVDYALAHQSIILFDAAYEAYITQSDIPHSIYEIDGAEKCAIEFRSFSKTAGFTGVRCGITVVPEALEGYTVVGGAYSLNKLWARRQTTKFNGASYPVQRAAAAVYSDEGWAQVREVIAYYMENARLIREGLGEAGFTVYGGVNAPYLWMKTPEGLSSWAFFDRLLADSHVVGTPGAGFGSCGEGFFRLSAFGSRENGIEAIQRIKAMC